MALSDSVSRETRDEVIDACAFTVAQGYDEDTVMNILEELGLDDLNDGELFRSKIKRYERDMEDLHD